MSAVRLGPVMQTKLLPRVTSDGRARISDRSDVDDVAGTDDGDVHGCQQ